MACLAGYLLNALPCTLHAGAMTETGSLLNALHCTLHVGAMTGTGSLLNALTCTLHVGAMTETGSLDIALPCTLHLNLLQPNLDVDVGTSMAPLPNDVGEFQTIQSMIEHAIGKSLLLPHKGHVWKEVLSLAVKEYEASNRHVSVSKDVKAMLQDYSGDMDGLCDSIITVIVENHMFSAPKSMPGVFSPKEVCLSTEYCHRVSVENPTVTMQKTLESDLQADVQKVALGHEEVTSWCHSQSLVPMDEPPLSCYLYSEDLCKSDLFINICSGVIKAWIWRGKTWALVEEGDPHPHISGYYVKASKDGDDKEKIMLPSFFLNFVAQEEMYMGVRHVFLGNSALMGPACAHQEWMIIVMAEYLELSDNKQKWVLQGGCYVW
ncbi:hypothetical protein EV401DRAFT_1895067 [Pisolithus croceorrhizus]|nr:hypothetical protein EV401DRAFT_1895067 [Pisolithus croceorrhizus]